MIPGRMRRRTVTTLALVVVAACASAAEPVRFDAAWPDQPPGYGAATSRWTRSAKVYDGVDHVFTVQATAKSPQWRAAYVAERARRLKMTAEERSALAGTEKAAAAESWEFEVLFTTHKSEWNDLAKGPSSMWRVALVAADGREVLPTKIVADRRNRDEIASWFPNFESYTRAYVVTFPAAGADGVPLAGDGATSLTLRFGSAIGAAELVWSAAAAD
jgi:hypothetical protein